MRLATLVFLACGYAYCFPGLSLGEDSPAISPLIEQAQKGDPAVQLDLAIHYRDGKAVPKDYAEALHWGHLAADQGYPAAMDFVGYQYFQGWGVPQNFAIAAGYFKAASDKSASAMFNLGELYFGGRGVDLDMNKAVECWKRAGEMGHGLAAAQVAMAYMDGEGAVPNKGEALRWATKSADLDAEAGWVVLGELRYEDGQVQAAREAWEKGAPKKGKDAKEAADLLALIDYRTRKPEPGKFAIIEGPHVHQGYNNCGATSTTMLARFQGAKLNEWDFKRLCPNSPIGQGTDWAELVAASGKIGLNWKLVTFPADDKGFEDGTQFLRSEVDAGRPVVIDFTYEGPQYPTGKAGHTLLVTGYIDSGNQIVLRNPAKPTPGLQLMTKEEFNHFWRSSGYTESSNGVVVRPAIVIQATDGTVHHGGTENAEKKE
jgi:hypothetical protein